MKKILVVLILSIVTFSCKKSEPKIDGYLINGTAAGIYDGVRTFLKVKDERGRDIIMDTAIVFNEKFTFEGKMDSPDMWFLSVNSVVGDLPIIVENTAINVTINKNNIQESQIQGGEANSALNQYSQQVKDLSDQRTEANRKLRENNHNNDPNFSHNLNTQIEEINKKMMELPFEFIKNNSNNYFSLILVDEHLKNRNLDLATLEKIETNFQQLNSELKQTQLGARINTQLIILNNEKKSESALDIGKQAPEFSAPKADGQLLALNDIKGKVTIIDFWASWCGPCRRENPNVVNIYNKYHNKGLEIIGVSLDRPGQKDKWLQAIKDDKLTWHNVSNLQYFSDPVARLYNIKSIPATYILDSNGVIVAKNLRGAALETKIAELLN